MENTGEAGGRSDSVPGWINTDGADLQKLFGGSSLVAAVKGERDQGRGHRLRPFFHRIGPLSVTFHGLYWQQMGGRIGASRASR